MSGNATYGFVLFYDLHCAITAKRYMDGRVISGNKIRVSPKALQFRILDSIFCLSNRTILSHTVLCLLNLVSRLVLVRVQSVRYCGLTVLITL